MQTETKCHNISPPCYEAGEYIVTYQNPPGPKTFQGGLVRYGSCAGHIDKMRLGYNNMEYVSDERLESEVSTSKTTRPRKK